MLFPQKIRYTTIHSIIPSFYHCPMCVVDFRKLSDKYIELTENDGKGAYWWVEEPNDEELEEVVPLPIVDNELPSTEKSK